MVDITTSTDTTTLRTYVGEGHTADESGESFEWPFSETDRCTLTITYPDDYDGLRFAIQTGTPDPAYAVQNQSDSFGLAFPGKILDGDDDNPMMFFSIDDITA